MADNLNGLRQNWKSRGMAAREKALEAIEQMTMSGEKINFNSVSKSSGISKSFLYETTEIRKRIEEQRKREIDSEMNRRAKYDKTSRSKDVIIEAKSKRIAALEEENSKLKRELELLRGLLYSQK
jgi:hypothetical protein